MVPRVLFSCLKSAAAQRGNIARQLSGTPAEVCRKDMRRDYRRMCRLLKQVLAAGTCYALSASCTRNYNVGSVSFCLSDQISTVSGPDMSPLHPCLQRQWDHAANAHLGSIQIMPHSGRSVCWVCDECPLGCLHKWTARVSSRTNGTQCPFCANKKPCQHNCLATQAPAIAAEFSNKNKGTPHDCLSSSRKKLLWRCKLGHEWLAKIQHRTLGKTSCPHCYNSRRGSAQVRHPVLTDSQHPMMQHWDWEGNAKAGLDPSQITCRSDKKAHWICLRCAKGQPHRWQAAVNNMYDGRGCPCCSGHKACICSSLQSLAPEVAAEWDYTKNKGTPSDYTAFSNAKVWWHNDTRGSFQAAISDQTYVRKPQVGS